MIDFDTYLFDFDGTLVDSHDSLVEVFKGAYSSVGVEIDEAIVTHLMRVKLEVGYRELSAPEDEEHIKIFADNIIRLLDDEDVLKLTKTYEDTKRTLIRLKENHKRLGIVTSNSRKHVKDVLRFIGLDEDMFSVIIGNLECKKHKPDPEPILNALKELGISNTGVCYVGDGLDDMRCAVNAKVTPILVDRLNEYSSEFDIIIKDLDGLFLI